MDKQIAKIMKKAAAAAAQVWIQLAIVITTSNGTFASFVVKIPKSSTKAICPKLTGRIMGYKSAVMVGWSCGVREIDAIAYNLDVEYPNDHAIAETETIRFTMSTLTGWHRSFDLAVDGSAIRGERACQ